jgi:hypothetical protein
MRLLNLFINQLSAQIRRLQSDSRGVVALVIALALPLLAGFAALAVDTSTWSSAQNSAQGAADNAVLSAVVAAGAGASSTQITNEALANAALNGFTNGQNGVTVTLYNPPNDGPNAGKSGYYEVIVKQPQKLFFGGLLGTAPTVIGRSVAAIQGSPACLLALDPSAASAIGISNAAGVTANNCNVAANSSNATAVTVTNASSLTASQLNVVGNYSTSNASTISATIKTGAAATQDPYASLAVPSFSGCNQTNYSLSNASTATINPGVYCGGINVSNSSTLTMNPGVYIINGGSFSVGNACTVTGSGVSIVLTGPGTAGWGTVNISNASTVTLTAPSSGAMQGVAIYVDRNAPHNSDTIGNASAGAITGTIYSPSQTVNFANASSSGACEQLIADIITISNAASFGKSCGSLTVPGLQPTGGTKGVPVE